MSDNDLICPECKRTKTLCCRNDTPELRQLQNVTSLMASFLGHSEGLFGMELAGEGWTDGSDYCYFPKEKRLEDFTEQDCIDTLNHIHEWLAADNKHTSIWWNQSRVDK